jgi:glycosyltransferase involved in cell wall biosynthesis
MKILLIHQYFLEKSDGGGSRWNEMTKFWSNEGHEITVLSGMVHYSSGLKNPRYKGQYVFKDEDFDQNIKVIRSHVSKTYNTNFLGRLLGYFSFVISSIYAGCFYAREKYDIIVVTSPPLFIGITAYILSKLKGIPYVFEIRDLWPESAIDTGVVTNKFFIKMAYKFEAFIYKYANLIIVLTPAFKEKLINKKNIQEKKIIFIPNAADFSLVDQLEQNFDPVEFRKLHKIDQNSFVITYVGAHGVANHLEQLIDTAKLLKDHNILFLLIGDGMEKNRLKQIVSDNNLKNVKFIDSVPKAEIFKFILISDMGTSVLKKAETFKTVYSNKTFDYMSCRKPILMVIDGVSRDLVEAAGAGIFVEPENPNDFAEKILLYSRNKTMVELQGKNGYNYALMHFDRKVLAKKYLTSLKDNIK